MVLTRDILPDLVAESRLMLALKRLVFPDIPQITTAIFDVSNHITARPLRTPESAPNAM